MKDEEGALKGNMILMAIGALLVLVAHIAVSNRTLFQVRR